MYNSLECIRKAFSNLFYPLFIIGLVSWIGGFIYYTYYIVNLKADNAGIIKARVVLTGGTGRIAEGLKLLHDGSSGHMFISGVEPSVTVDDLVKEQPNKAKVDLGYDAQNTRGNAAESIVWVKQHGFKSIRLITSNYHVPRSLLEFHAQMPDLTIYVYPVEPYFFGNASPASSFKKFVVLFREYNKLLGVITRLAYSRLRTDSKRK